MTNVPRNLLGILRAAHMHVAINTSAHIAVLIYLFIYLFYME